MSSDLHIERIPPEMLDLILDHLAADEPRLGEDPYLRQQPYLASTQDQTQAKQPEQPAPLKALSLVSKRFHIAVRSHLFRRLQLTVYPPELQGQEQYPPRDSLFNWIAGLSEIAGFVRSNNLAKTTNSFILKIVDGQGHYRVDYQEELKRDVSEESALIRRQWRCLLNELPLIERLTIIAPPFCLGILLSIPISPYISEDLHMPYHLLSIGRDIGQTLSSEQILPEQLTKRDNSETHLSLLTSKEWTSMLLNEGSFVRWYEQQIEWHHEPLSVTSFSRDNKKLPDGFLAHVVSFEYVGIFPPLIPFMGLMGLIGSMPMLHSFRFHFQPVGDLLYDSAQRESISFTVLEGAMVSNFDLIFDSLPTSHGESELESYFRQLTHVQCMDEGVDLQRIWGYCFAGLEKKNWETVDTFSIKRKIMPL